MARTQEQRRAETRAQLLDRGRRSVRPEGIPRHLGRGGRRRRRIARPARSTTTSAARKGLLVALLEQWVGQTIVDLAERVEVERRSRRPVRRAVARDHPPRRRERRRVAAARVRALAARRARSRSRGRRRRAVRSDARAVWRPRSTGWSDRVRLRACRRPRRSSRCRSSRCCSAPRSSTDSTRRRPRRRGGQRARRLLGLRPPSSPRVLIPKEPRHDASRSPTSTCSRTPGRAAVPYDQFDLLRARGAGLLARAPRVARASGP